MNVEISSESVFKRPNSTPVAPPLSKQNTFQRKKTGVDFNDNDDLQTPINRLSENVD